MAQLTLDVTGIKGLTNRYYGDKSYSASKPNHRYFGAEGEVAEGIYNPISHLGFLSPANATTKTVSGTTSFLLTTALLVPSNTLIGTADSVYFGDEAVTGTEGQIMELDTQLDVALAQGYEIPVFGSPDQYSKVEDLVLYQVNGTQKVFWASRNTTGGVNPGDIGIANISLSSPDPDWGTAVHSLSVFPGGSRMTLVPADNGFLYLLESNAVHKIDGGGTAGTNGALTEFALVFLGVRGSTNNDITQLIDGVDLRGRMWIGLHVNQGVSLDVYSADDRVFAQHVGIYVWDRRTTVASMQDYIPIVGARELKSMHVFQGQACCFTISTDGYTQFRVWNGSEMKVIKTLGKDAYPPYKKHSVHEDGDLIYWIGNDGKVYCYGKIEPGMQNALYIIGDMTEHVTENETFSGSGVLIASNTTETVTSGRNAEGMAFYVSFKDTGGNHLKKWYPHSIDLIDSNQQLAHQGDVFSKVKYLPDMSTVKYVAFRCLPVEGTGTDVVATVKYYFNHSATASITKDITKDDLQIGYIRHELNKQYINAIQVEIEWSTTETAGVDYFRPSVAIIDYDPTETKG